MKDTTIFAATLPGLGESRCIGESYEGRGIALYELVTAYGFSESMPTDNRHALDLFAMQFEDVKDPLFGLDDLDRRRIQFRINPTDRERRILLLSFDDDYPGQLSKLERVAKTLEIPLIRDEDAMPEILKWIPHILLNR